MGLFKAQPVLFMGGFWTVMLISFFEYPSCHFGAQWFHDIHKSINAHSGHNALDACKWLKKEGGGGPKNNGHLLYMNSLFRLKPLIVLLQEKKPSLWFHRGASEIIDRVCLSGWCSSREWEGQGEKRGGVNTRPSVISWPCEGVLVFLHHHKEKDSGSAQSIQGGAGWGVEFRADWCYTASQLGVSVCYNCRGTSPSPFFSFCVWASETPVFQHSLLKLRLQFGVCCSDVGDFAFFLSPQLIVHNYIITVKLGDVDNIWKSMKIVKACLTVTRSAANLNDDNR